MIDPLVEIRVPTYKRPSLLRRCLSSIQQQTYKNWVAIVMDDSLQQEGRQVVDELSDSRITYHPNKKNIGCSANIDQAFRPDPILNGSHACVVEDDNWLLPKFLEINVSSLNESGARVVLMNQRILPEDISVEANHECLLTTRGGIFGSESRLLSRMEVRAALFYCEGLSNGGIFWKIHPDISFFVGEHVTHSPMQEYCRSLQLKEAVYYSADPHAVFSMSCSGKTTREPLENRRFNRGRLGILSALVKHHGQVLIDVAKSLASKSSIMKKTLDLSLSEISPKYILSENITLLQGSQAWAKGLAKKFTISDPLNIYWKHQGNNIIRSF